MQVPAGAKRLLRYKLRRNVILSEAKLQRSGRKSARPGFQSQISFGYKQNGNESEMLKGWPHASHFVAALRST
jgi:hypothetical protein